METPAYDPRGMKAQGLAFATSNRGGCHLRANMLNPEILGVPKMVDRFATLGKSGLLIDMQNLNAVLDSLSVCKFTSFAMKKDYYARLLSAVWGETIEPQDLLLLGERIWTAERLFNLAAGFTRADDTLPPRLLHEPVSSGPSAGQVVDLPPMLDEYYVARGWDAEGRPTPAKLEVGWPGRAGEHAEASSSALLRRPFVIITGGIDLSCGTVMMCSAIIGGTAYKTWGWPMWTSLVVIMVVAIAFGFINGILVSRLRLPPFIATLGTMMVSMGVGSMVSRVRSATFPTRSEDDGWFKSIFKFLGDDGLTIPTGFIVLLLIAVIAYHHSHKNQDGPLHLRHRFQQGSRTALGRECQEMGNDGLRGQRYHGRNRSHCLRRRLYHGHAGPGTGF